MGRSVGDMAANAVARGSKKKPEDRTPEQILKDIRTNLAAKLAVTPDDQRFLLGRYDALEESNNSLILAMAAAKAAQDETNKKLQEDIERIESDIVSKAAAETMKQAIELIAESEAAAEAASGRIEPVRVEYHVHVPRHVGNTARIISEVGDVNVVGDVKPTGFDEAPTVDQQPIYDITTGETTDAQES